MDKAHFPLKIESARLQLRKNDLAMAQTIFAAVDRDRKRLGRFLPWVDDTRSVEEEISYINSTHEKWDRHELYDYSIFLQDGTYIGNAGLHSLSWTADRCEIGYWILRQFEGQGYMSEACKVLIEAAFEVGFNRIEIRCDPENERSASVPRRLGFRFEGRLEQDTKDSEGRYRDSLVFARLKSQGPIK